ncbi:hypothetical protein R2R35_18770 [Anaerocolumna sp. AGMB13020]|uniref:hypothetical protein n=1 Tax=Anaerocolumna sp. AGMB13020 TaxID=3081750 RepID=UPI00295416DD|nr:hypothetical protein [Anaerocolumna sp. AGMB13020]WOO35822.1 hypothetical protein R2R35_18770 [Anaerocolumna sp. AGMB13020]
MIKRKYWLSVSIFLVALFFSLLTLRVSAADTFATAESLTLNKISEGTLYTEDYVSYYKFVTSDSDSYYKIELRNTEATENIALSLYSDNDLTTEVYSLSAGKSSVGESSRKLEPNHTYYILVKSQYSSIWLATGKYKLSVSEIKDDVADNFDKSKLIPLNKKVAYNLETEDDVDFFKFKTTTNDSFYKVEISNSGATDGIGIFLYSENDSTTGITDFIVPVAKSNSTVLKLKPNKTYYIAVKRSSSYYKPTGIYKIKIKEIKDDASDTFKKSKTLLFNKKNSFKINTDGDIDYFKFKPSKTGYYNITLANGCNDSINATIFNEDDITQNIGSISTIDGTKKTSKFKFKANHTYYISVQKSYSFRTVEGAYSLTLKSIK